MADVKVMGRKGDVKNRDGRGRGWRKHDHTIILDNGKKSSFKSRGRKSRGRKRVAEVTAGMSRADENAARNKRCNR